MPVEATREAASYTPAMGNDVIAGGRYELAHFGDLIGDPSRAAMLLSLMDGRARPATELAAVAAVSLSTASSHLRKLLDGGLVSVGAQGRHRYYRIADDTVAQALEGIALRTPVRTVPLTPAQRALKEARTCYRHLAGELGVSIFGALERREWLVFSDGALRLSASGRDALPDVADVTGRTCLDWTERRTHLGGPLGVAVADALFARRWIARGPRERAVRVTTAGRRGLTQLLGL